MLKYIVAFIITTFAAYGANAETKIKSIVMDSGGIPFLLDDKGDVWAFKYPLSLEEPIKLPNLHHIKKIAPFIALGEDGKVYTWELDKKTKWEDELNMDAYYIAPKLIENLSNVNDIDSATPQYFAAVEDGKRVYQWESRIYKFSPDVKIGNTEPKLVYSNNGIKNISITGNRTVLLLENNNIIGWGDNHQGQLGDDERRDIPPEKPAIFSLEDREDKIEKIFASYSYVIALTQDQTVFFWGDCNRKNRIKQKARTTALNDISDMATSKKDDNNFYDIYINNDGSLWLSYAPVPKEKENCSDLIKNSDIKSSIHPVNGISAPMISLVAISGRNLPYYGFAIGSDNTIWGITVKSEKDEVKKISVNLKDSRDK